MITKTMEKDFLFSLYFKIMLLINKNEKRIEFSFLFAYFKRHNTIRQHFKSVYAIISL